MVHRHKSTLPQWYAESKFLETEATSRLSDQTLNYTFGHLFQTPSNPGYRNGNQLQINFCHLEFPWDCTGALSDPPLDIPNILRKLEPQTPRCIIDSTLKNRGEVQRLEEKFGSAGYRCETNLVDQVLCLEMTGFARDEAGVGRGPVEGEGGLDLLVESNQRSFGYEDAEWLRIKLQRTLDQPESFQVFTACSQDAAGSGESGRVDAFAVVFVPVDKAPDLALVQVVGTVPECRRQGLASSVLRKAIAGLPDSVCRVYLTACDAAAIALYKGLGFEVVGEITTTECVFSSVSDS